LRIPQSEKNAFNCMRKQASLKQQNQKFAQ
jgi:hypothetical protein